MNRLLASSVFALLSAVWNPAVAGANAHEIPPVFSKVSYAEALASNEKDKKTLLVKATAEWCGPCKMMDKTTWRDEQVVAWVGVNAVAIQLDVDQEQNVAEELSVSAMPTTIAFKQGKEFDRLVGYVRPDEMVRWLEGVQRGERAIDIVRQRAGEESAAGVEARMNLARMLVERQQFEEAAGHYAWLWDNMLTYTPSMLGVRTSFMASEMSQVAAQSETAKAKFAAIRDRVEEQLKDGSLEIALRHDWVTLNEIVADDARTLAWYDTIKGTSKGRERAKKLAWNLADKLSENGRWADLGRFYPAPMQRYRDIIEGTTVPADMGDEDTTPEQREAMLEWYRADRREQLAQLYVSLLAAERHENAQRVLDASIKDDPSDELKAAFASLAEEAGVASAEHLRWIEATPDTLDGRDDLLERLRRAISNAERQPKD